MLRNVEAEERARRERINYAWAAYEGRLQDPLVVKPQTYNDNVKLNFASLVVDTGVTFLFGQPPDWELEQPGREIADRTQEQTEEPEEVYLDAVWKQNKKPILLHNLGVNGAIAGHVFLKMQLRPDLTYPRLIALDPATMTMYAEQDDYEDVYLFKQEWVTVDYRGRRPVMVAKRQWTLRAENRLYWTVIDEESRGTATKWTEVGRFVWPQAWSPIFHCQNMPLPNVLWGESDLEPDIIEICKAINFAMSNRNRILRFHAHPKTWGSGFNPDSVRMDVDTITVIPNPEGVLKNLEMVTDLQSSENYTRELKEALFMISRTPEIASGKVDNIGKLSGVALKLLYGPLLSKTGTKQVLYGDMFDQVNSRLLELQGTSSERAEQMSTEWHNPLPVDSIEDAQAATLKKALGVSQDTLLQQLGYDPANEAANRQRELEESIQKQAAMQAVMPQQPPPGGGNT